MACTNCGCKNKPCGCEDTPLTTPAPCNPIGCPDPYPCSEVINAECVIYTGDDILCNQDVVVSQDTNMTDALNQVVDYCCQELPASVTLTNVGQDTSQSLVNDGTGPALAVKGLKAGTGISLSSTSTDITVTNSNPDQTVVLNSGTGISTSGTYPNFTITNSAPNVDQNLWATFAATTGSTTADTTTDTLTVVGTGGIATSITGDTLTIDGSKVVSNQFNYEIGQYVASEGGVIAYRWLSTTPGGTPELGTVQNYIVVDTNDLSTSAQWSSITVNIPNVGSQYDGPLNTTNLIAAGAGSGITAGVAADLCATSTNNGKGDWYLPAIDELSKIFNNRWDIAQGITVAAGTQLGYLFYWSSTQEDALSPTLTAYAFSFPTGGISSEGKPATYGVRAVRRIYI